MKRPPGVKRLAWRASLAPLALSSVILAACEEASDPLAMPPEQRGYERAQLLRGEQLFAQNCAICHGPGAIGDPNWRTRDPSGRFPPPPLNGTAHAWHHPLSQLRHTIANGGPKNASNMPAWGETLSDAQIDDVIAWFQSLWPDAVYEAWYTIEMRARKNTKG